MNSKNEEIIDVIHAWDRAMVSNNVVTIGLYMAADWLIIGPDGNVDDKKTFLDLISSGKRNHNVMESHDLSIRLYDNTAVVTGHGVSGGEFDGEPFYLEERVSCIFIKQQDKWKCVLTHLSKMDSI